MKKNTNKNQNFNKALELLPWYATGKLAPDDLTFMDEAFTSYPELKNQLIKEKAVIQSVKNNPEVLNYSALEAPEDRVEHILGLLTPQTHELKTKLQAEQETDQENSIFSSKLKQLINKLLPSNQQFGHFSYGSFALGLLVAVVALLYTFNNSPVIQESVFYPATKSQTTDLKNNPDDTVLLLGVNGKLDSPKLLKLLQKVEANISAVPNKAGMYRVTLGKKLNSITVNALLDELRAEKELVWFAGESN